MGVKINVMKQNILDEAYSQLITNYPAFAQFIVKYSLDEINPDGSEALGSFKLLISGIDLTIPIIYRDGNVDCVSYIGYDNTGRYYALTKLLYNKLVNSISNSIGQVLTKDDMKDKEGEIAVDKGIIGSLFATPMTYSPKVASDNYTKEVSTDEIISGFKTLKFKKIGLPGINKTASNEDSSLLSDMAFKDKEFAKSIVKIASKNETVKKMIEMVSDYSEIERYAKLSDISKIASANKKPVVYFTRDEIRSLPEYEKEKAFKKIATQGFYVKNSDVLTKVAEINSPTLKEIVKESFLKNLSEVTDSGVYTLFDKELNPYTYVVASKLGDNKKIMLSSDNVCDYLSDSKNPIMGIKKDEYGMSIDSIIKLHIKKWIDENPSSEKGGVLLANNGNEIFYIKYWSGDLIKLKNGRIVIEQDFGPIKQVVVVPNGEITRIIRNNDILYIPEKNAFFIKDDAFYNSSNKCVLFRSEDINNLMLTKTAEVIQRRDGKIEYNGDYYSKEGFVIKLANEGYKEEEISKIIKEAAKQPDTVTPLYQLNEQMSQLIQMAQQQQLTMQQVMMLIAQMKQSIDIQTSTLQQFATAGAMAGQQPSAEGQTEPADIQELQNGNTQPASSNGSTPQDAQQSQSEDQDKLNKISELCQQIGQDPNQLIQAAQQQGLSLDDLLVQLENYVAQVQNSQQGGQQPQQQPDAQPQPDDLQAQQMADAGTQQQGMQADNGPQTPPVDDNGFMVQNIDPEMLEQLKEIADKKVLESAIISYLATLDTPVAVIKSYIEQLKDGVNGMVRVLMIIDSNYHKMLDSVSDGMLSSFLNKGKALSKKMTDFIINLEGI